MHVNFKKRQRNMSNLRYGYVVCHYMFIPHVECHQALCRMSKCPCCRVDFIGFKDDNKHRRDVVKSGLHIRGNRFLNVLEIVMHSHSDIHV